MKKIYEKPQTETLAMTVISRLMENSGETDEWMGNESTLSFEEEEEEDGGENDLWNQDLSLNWNLWD